MLFSAMFSLPLRCEIFELGTTELWCLGVCVHVCECLFVGIHVAYPSSWMDIAINMHSAIRVTLNCVRIRRTSSEVLVRSRGKQKHNAE